MNAVNVSKLIEFRKLTERSQATFAKNLKIPKKPKLEDNEGGGNYWQRSLSGVSTSFKNNDNNIVKERINSLLAAYEPCDKEKVRNMYKKNLNILQKYEDFDFSVWNPSATFKFISKTDEPLIIKDIPFRVMPQHIFRYGTKEYKVVGGVFFVVSVAGYEPEDLGIFSESIFKYLSKQYPDGYYVDPSNCFTINIANMEVVRYQDILDGKIKSQFDNTINSLKKYL